MIITLLYKEHFHLSVEVSTQTLCCPQTKVTILGRWFSVFRASHDKAASTAYPWDSLAKHHSLGDSNNRNSFFHNSGGHKSKFKVSAGLVSLEASLLGCSWVPTCRGLTCLPLSTHPGDSFYKDYQSFQTKSHPYELLITQLTLTTYLKANPIQSPNTSTL